MTRTRPRFLLLLACLALAALSTVACDNPFSHDSPSEPNPTIDIGGFCRGDSVGFNRQIVCEDTSETRPNGHLDTITFILQSSSTGLTIETRVIRNADQVPSPRQENFTGIPAGTYQVIHEVKSDKGDVVRRTYRNISV